MMSVEYYSKDLVVALSVFSEMSTKAIKWMNKFQAAEREWTTKDDAKANVFHNLRFFNDKLTTPPSSSKLVSVKESHQYNCKQHII